MKTTLFLAFFLGFTLCPSARTARAQTPQLTGHIEGIGNQPILFWYEVDGQRRSDTVNAVNDRFTYQLRASDDSLISLFIAAPRFTSFWYEGGPVTVTGNAEVPYKLTFEGGPENEVLNEYNRTVGWVDESATAPQAALRFSRDHPTSRTAAYLLYHRLRAAATYDDVYQSTFETLTPAVRESYFGKKAAQIIEALRNQPVVGGVAPDFTIADTAGVDVSLGDFRGKYVLLDFWGHWCSPCIASFPAIKALREKYPDRLAIVGIANERRDHRDQWMKAIRKHGADWTQLSELSGGDGRVQTRYHITKWPTYLLLDKQGVILKRTSFLKYIERELEDLL